MIRYVNTKTTKLYTRDGSGKELIELLWGDQLTVLDDSDALQTLVKARNCTGYVNNEAIGDTPLLELYFIDVGQGDGILIVTPDRKHILIDGGYNRKKQPHGKSAADFVDWKFKRDYGKNKILLDAMIASHCDADHYGGLWDLVNPNETEGLDTHETVVNNFYHAGVSWWQNAAGTRSLGESKDGYLTTLLGDRSSLEEALSNDTYKLQGEWGKFLSCINDTGCNVQRLGYNADQDFQYVPDFGPGENDVNLKVLGPVCYHENGVDKVRNLGSDSKNTNGNSILLRLDYGRARILLTGDLNKNSQQDILNAFKGNRQELAADVVKSCHHGSDDCSYEFLECVHASATIISSGDDENHAHPRPNIVAASGAAGFKTVEKDEMITPLVFSTEISRSMRIGEPQKFEAGGAEYQPEEVHAFYTRVASGALRGQKKEIDMHRARIVDGIVYGLVNVRTDGERILCATLNEGKYKWEIKQFNSRF